MEHQPIHGEIISIASILQEVSLQMHEHQRADYIKRGLEVEARQKADKARKTYRKSENYTKYYRDIQVEGYR